MTPIHLVIYIQHFKRLQRVTDKEIRQLDKSDESAE